MHGLNTHRFCVQQSGLATCYTGSNKKLRVKAATEIKQPNLRTLSWANQRNISVLLATQIRLAAYLNLTRSLTVPCGLLYWNTAMHASSVFSLVKPLPRPPGTFVQEAFYLLKARVGAQKYKTCSKISTSRAFSINLKVKLIHFYFRNINIFPCKNIPHKLSSKQVLSQR